MPVNTALFLSVSMYSSPEFLGFLLLGYFSFICLTLNNVPVSKYAITNLFLIIKITILSH